MTESTRNTSAAFIILAMIAVLVGFVLSIGVGLQSSAVPLVYLSFFGNAAAWTALFILGLRWYGKAPLWLLLVAPFALYPVALFLLFASFLGTP